MAGRRLGVGVIGAAARLVEEFGICETFKMARPDDVEFRDVEIPARYYPPGGIPRESWRTPCYWVDLPLDASPATTEG